MIKKKPFLLPLACASLLISNTLLAQDLGSMSGAKVKRADAAPPPDCTPKVKEPGAWDLSAAVGFNLASGNINSNLLTAGFAAAREKDEDLYNFTLNGAQGEQEGETTQKFIRSTASYNKLLSDRFYAGAGASFISDDIAGVDYRGVLNPGIGYFVVKEEDVSLSFEAGPAYVWQKLGVKTDFLAARAANEFKWKLSETAKVFQTAEYLLNTDQTEEYIVIGTVGIEATLTSALALVTSVQDRYNSVPAPGRESNDVIVTSALKVSF